MAKSPVSNHAYNLANQLSKKLKAVKHYSKINNSANTCSKCSGIIKKIKDDDAKHAKMLQAHINELGKKSKFK